LLLGPNLKLGAGPGGLGIWANAATFPLCPQTFFSFLSFSILS
jgi:hypothetical protein